MTGWVPLQQECDAGISGCPHWALMVRQQARSPAVMVPPGTRQAIAGATLRSNSMDTTPTWRSLFTVLLEYDFRGNGASLGQSYREAQEPLRDQFVGNV